MKHTIHHKLPIDTVRTACQKALDVYKSNFTDYQPEATWTTENHADISFVALGKKLEGYIDLQEDAIELSLDVPFMFKPFQGKAMEIIEKEIKKWLGKAENGELDDSTEKE